MTAPVTRESALHTMSQKRRRALVLVLQIGMAVYALAAIITGFGVLWVSALAACLQFSYVVIFFRILRPIMVEAIDHRSDLDERQLRVRDRAFYRAYGILMLIVGAVLTTSLPVFVLVDALRGGSGGISITLNSWQVIGVNLFVLNLFASLPACVIAWNEPDPETEGGIDAEGMTR